MKLKFCYFVNRIFKLKIKLLIILILALIINIVLNYTQLFQKIFGSSRISGYYQHGDLIHFNEIEENGIVQKVTQLDVTSTKTVKKEIEYPHLKKCHHFYNNSYLNNYTLEADKKLHDIRFVRGILVYFPVEKSEYFEQEFKWLYRSWFEMLKYEPKMWRTDIIVFLDHNKLNSTYPTFKATLDSLNCKITNVRKSRNDLPMCTIVNYVSITERQIPFLNNTYFETTYVDQVYNELYKETDVFIDTDQNLWKFYGKLQQLKDYNYIDSILMAFDGYKYFKDNFDFLLRSDMDVFITPFFGKWLPLKCNEFITGMGGYSHDFNMKRLRKAAKFLGLKFGEIRNLGSTWYSTPEQFRLVSYLTLVSMVYIGMEEFSETERQGKVGTILWPEWHYGVLLLYGQNLAMNHLITTDNLYVHMLGDLIDYPSANEESVFSKVHIHVYHGEDMFSKFMFRDGRYENLTYAPANETYKVKYYCLNLALESRKKYPIELNSMLESVIKSKA